MTCIWRATACSVAGVFLAIAPGCAVNQENEVAQYRRIVDCDGQPPPAFTPGQPISLEQALTLANQHNERIALQGESYLQALIAKDRAASNFLPSISLAPTHSEQDNPGAAAAALGPSGEGAGAFASSSNSRTDVPLTGRMNLFNGFADLANYQAAGRTIQQRRALLLDAQAAVLLDVARTYYQVLRSERSVAVLLASLATQDERVRDIRARQKAGIARPLDTAQTEAQAAATRVSLIAAQNDVATGRSTLSFLLGVPANDSPLVDEAQLPQAAPSLAALQDQAARQRQDLSAAVQALEAAKLSVNAAIAQYYPSVTLNVNYFLSRQSTPTESDWNYLLSANLPIFSAGLIEANVRQAWSLLRQAKLSETQVRRQVVQDVEVACQNFQASRDRLKELQVQLAAAEEALRQAEQSYRVGLATNLERLTAQDALLSAQLQLASERYNQKVFYLNLLRAAGALTTRLPGEPATAPTTAPATRPGTMPAGE